MQVELSRRIVKISHTTSARPRVTASFGLSVFNRATTASFTGSAGSMVGDLNETGKRKQQGNSE